VVALRIVTLHVLADILKLPVHLVLKQRIPDTHKLNPAKISAQAELDIDEINEKPFVHQPDFLENRPVNKATGGDGEGYILPYLSRLSRNALETYGTRHKETR